MWTDDFDILVDDKHIMLKMTHTIVKNTINQTSISMKFTVDEIEEIIDYLKTGIELIENERESKNESFR